MLYARDHPTGAKWNFVIVAIVEIVSHLKITHTVPESTRPVYFVAITYTCILRPTSHQLAETSMLYFGRAYLWRQWARLHHSLGGRV
jgi:hypothetical protein